MGESLIENSGEGCYLGLGEECWRHDPTLLACPIIHVIAPELNRVFTVAGPTLARRPASGAAFDGIVEARCNQNSTIGPFHFAVCGETILLSPGNNHASNLTEERAKVVASILCIDDDPRVLDLYTALLGAKGYTVLTAPDGPTGLAITRKYSISVVVLDFRMPGLDGNQVARVLMQEHPKLPVVMCSGFPDDIPESLKWFADVVLEKGRRPPHPALGNRQTDPQ